jgi:hypothetical protein
MGSPPIVHHICMPGLFIIVPTNKKLVKIIYKIITYLRFGPCFPSDPIVPVIIHVCSRRNVVSKNKPKKVS